MGDHHLQRLVQLAQSRWPDTWWTIGQVDAYHGTDSNAINNRIKRGTLPAARWGNWWIKRSDALKLHLWLGKGYSCKEWSPAADCYILRAHASGLNDSEIGYRMKWTHQQVFYRRTLLTGKYKMQQTIPPKFSTNTPDSTKRSTCPLPRPGVQSSGEGQHRRAGAPVARHPGLYRTVH